MADKTTKELDGYWCSEKHDTHMNILMEDSEWLSIDLFSGKPSPNIEKVKCLAMVKLNLRTGEVKINQELSENDWAN